MTGAGKLKVGTVGCYLNPLPTSCRPNRCRNGGEGFSGKKEGDDDGVCAFTYPSAVSDLSPSWTAGTGKPNSWMVEEIAKSKGHKIRESVGLFAYSG